MPTTFVSTTTRIWGAALRRCSSNARLVRMYVATAPARTSEGIFPMSLGYASIDTGLTEDEVRSALKELDAVGLVGWDEEQELVLDRESLEVMNYTSADDRRLKAAVKLIRTLPASPLIHEFHTLAARMAPPLARALAEVESDRGYPTSRSELMG